MVSDLWILRHIWDYEEQRELLAGLVNETISEASAVMLDEHPRGREHEPPDPERLAGDLRQLETLIADLPVASRESARDRLSLLANRSEWVENQEQRQSLKAHIETLWEAIG